MASVSIPYNFVNGTTANAEEVDANFNSVKSFVDTALVQVDGSVKAGLSALAAEVLNMLVPTGTISPFAGSTAPTGWLLCDGTTSTSGYPALAAMVGATTPNLKGRAIVGFDAGQTEFNLIGKTGGEKSVVLTEAQLASHNHSQNSHSHTASTGEAGSHSHVYVQPYNTSAMSAGGPLGYIYYERNAVTDDSGVHTHSVTVNSATATNNPAGSNAAHNNLQPYAVYNYIIKT